MEVPAEVRSPRCRPGRPSPHQLTDAGRYDATFGPPMGLDRPPFMTGRPRRAGAKPSAGTRRTISEHTGTGGPVGRMDENRAHRVVDALRERGVPAHLERAGVHQFGVRVMLTD